MENWRLKTKKIETCHKNSRVPNIRPTILGVSQKFWKRQFYIRGKKETTMNVWVTMLNKLFLWLSKYKGVLK